MQKVRIAELRKVFTTLDAIEEEKFVIVRLKIIPEGDLSLEEAAALLAINTSLGTITPLDFEKENLRRATSAKVLFTGRESHYVDIAYPIHLCEPQSGISQLLSVILYNSEYNFTRGYWVDDIHFPKSYTQHFAGPRFGISGIRDMMGVPNRPLLGVILKPRGGAYFEAAVSACREALLGGFDYIIDDELIVDPEGDFAFDNRVKKLSAIARQASSETGETKWYIANINSTPARAFYYAKKAKELGANALLVNAFTIGFAAVEDLVSDRSIGIPIITSNMGIASITRPTQNIGISEVVISKLSRIVGVDGAYSGIVGASWYSDDIFRASLAALRRPLHHLSSTFPVVAGGLNIANLGENLIFQGNDVMLQVGTGIMGYPSGPREGARAFRFLVESLDPNFSLEEMERKIVELGKKYEYIKTGLKSFGFTPKSQLRDRL